MSFNDAIKFTRQILDEAKVDDGHGIDHALAVLRHAICALEEYNLSDETKWAVKLAALTHDLDDSKFFPQNKNNENSLKVLTMSGYSQKIISEVIEMIGLVSCSKNRNKIVEPKYKLIPRWADRLEAMGEIGLARGYFHAKHKNSPLFLDSTPRAKNIIDLFEIATEDRFNNYQGTSASMIDHLYDKVLHLVNLGSDSFYINNVAAERHQILVDFCLDFGEEGEIDYRRIQLWETMKC